MTAGRWLAIVAALAMAAGAPGAAGAASRAKVAARPKHRTVAHRHVPVPVVQAVAVPIAAPEPAPVAAYRWLDDADAMMTAVGDTAPNLRFADVGGAGYAWALDNGAVVVAEPMGPGDTRYYFFDADMTAPFLVRDRLWVFGFDRGTLSAVYDAEGRPARWATGDPRERLADDLYARGRRLWFAARTPARVAAAPSAGRGLFDVVAVFGGGGRDDRWRDGRGHAREERRRDGERYRTGGPSNNGQWTGVVPERTPGRGRGDRDGTTAVAVNAPTFEGDDRRGRAGDRRGGVAASVPALSPVPVDVLPPGIAPSPIAFAAPEQPVPTEPNAGPPRRMRGDGVSRRDREASPPASAEPEVALVAPEPSPLVGVAPPPASEPIAAVAPEPPAPRPEPVAAPSPPPAADPAPAPAAEERRHDVEPDGPRPDQPD